jgi:hypothetical protein
VCKKKEDLRKKEDIADVFMSLEFIVPISLEGVG